MQCNRALGATFVGNAEQNVTGVGMFRIDTVDDNTEPNIQPDIRLFFNVLGFHLDFEDGRTVPQITVMDKQ